MKRRGRPPHPDVLTPRQWQVLALVRQGLSDREIAQRLGISLDGAKFHVSEILGKLGLSNRNEAARWHEERTSAPTACLGRRGRPRLAAMGAGAARDGATAVTRFASSRARRAPRRGGRRCRPRVEVAVA